MSSVTRITAQVASISIALIASGGIATLSLFDIPLLQAQPADRSLPSVRWLFSRGSHVFPQAAALSCAGFLYLAYDALPAHTRSLMQLFKTTNGFKVNAYLAAAILTISIGPYTQRMISNNFALIKKNEEKGGARSSNSAKALEKSGNQPGQRSAEDSVNSKGEGGIGVELTDLSNPQEKTPLSSSPAENQEVKEMLDKFARQNMVRAVLMTAGGVVGLVAALS